MVAIWYVSMEGETLASSESRLFAIERSERAKGVLRAKTGMGFHPESSSTGAPAEEIKREPIFRDRAKRKSERRAPSVDFFGGKSE